MFLKITGILWSHIHSIDVVSDTPNIYLNNLRILVWAHILPEVAGEWQSSGSSQRSDSRVEGPAASTPVKAENETV